MRRRRRMASSTGCPDLAGRWRFGTHFEKCQVRFERVTARQWPADQPDHLFDRLRQTAADRPLASPVRSRNPTCLAMQ